MQNRLPAKRNMHVYFTVIVHAMRHPECVPTRGVPQLITRSEYTEELRYLYGAAL